MDVLREDTEVTSAGIDASTLAELEAIVEHGWRTMRRGFVEVGTALREIRESKLYRETHATWESYCRERWAWGSNYANKIIRAATLVEETGTAVPTEREARALFARPKKKTDLSWVAALSGAPRYMTGRVLGFSTVVENEPESSRGDYLGDPPVNEMMVARSPGRVDWAAAEALAAPLGVRTRELVARRDTAAVLRWALANAGCYGEENRRRARIYRELAINVGMPVDTLAERIVAPSALPRAR